MKKIWNNEIGMAFAGLQNSLGCVLMFFLVAALVCLSSARAAISFDWATVGDVGNPNDSTGYGGVSTAYQIATKEVNLIQYTEFLNAVAATDHYDLYNEIMALDTNITGISQNGSSGSYTYSVLGSGLRPVTYVSWNDSARFVNWMENGQGAGSTETGVYDMSLGTPVRSGSATYFLPTENEWYKAAYYQPTAQGGDSDGYWLYPMQTNSVPFSDQPPGATPDNSSVGNFYRYNAADMGYNDGYAVSGSTSDPLENVLTDGGAYTNSESYYGTYDQGGNVNEWNETMVTGSSRGQRGGSWLNAEGDLRSSARYLFGSPTRESSDTGFRIAIVPEPTPWVLMLLMGGAALQVLSRRK